MSATTLTPHEAACEFLRVIREGEYDEGDYDQRAHWSMDGQAVAWHHGWDVISDFGLDAEDDEALWLDRTWSEVRGVATEELAEVCSLFTLSGDLSISRTRFLDLLDTTTTNDAREFCHIAGIDRRDPWVVNTLDRHGLSVGSKEYEPLREAAHSTNPDYAIALLRTDLSLDAIVQLCALPPMPVEYAIAMAGGAA
ncbi:hypothetical protein JF550_11150 [Microbacterium esteraromaticum]|uniref:Uncharacterized protein n=1 Tax=Microbacterium esteraromaticum TaxID=57043 RepID=A0A939DYD9_9MICO|nr:hypothetical protein [Microbacterium esteraromaticum]MBN8206507.1 hypothetical protein [Microbacterium esteraromaticum]MBN8416662.1 hypothetical protein [Microbacterium esteraromaticum]